MKAFQYSSEELHLRAQALIQIQNRYDEVSLKLHDIFDELLESYHIDDLPVVYEEMNLSSSLADLSLKIGKMAQILQERAETLENESLNSKREL